jgi:hypothetical protein
MIRVIAFESIDSVFSSLISTIIRILTQLDHWCNVREVVTAKITSKLSDEDLLVINKVLLPSS